MKHFTMIRHGSSQWSSSKPRNYTTTPDQGIFLHQVWKLPFLACMLLFNIVSITPQQLYAANENGMFMPVIYLGDSPDDAPTCNCLNNATTLSNGQFSEVVTIAAPTGESWTVLSNTGFYQSGSPAPPAAPLLIANGTAIPESGDTPGIYQLPGIHVDGLGFSLTVTNGTDELTISNTCYYPNISIVNLPDEICMSSLPFTLQADNNGIAGTGAFTIDGNPASVFSPQALGPGNHTITYTFDAGTGTPENAGDPGCIQQVSEDLFVKAVPTIVVNNQVNASLGSDCMITLLPDHVMEGTYPCIDDYIVTVFDPNGVPLGNKVSSDYMGTVLRVEISTLAGGYTGFGNVLLIDNAPPVIAECAPDTDKGTVNKKIQFTTGTLALDDAFFYPTNFACLSKQVDVEGQSHFYDLYTFSVSATDNYIFELDTDFGFGAALLYDGGFSMLLGPCLNYIAQPSRLDAGEGYFTGSNESIRMMAHLEAGKEYTLLTTSANGTQVGDYVWAIYAEKNGKVNDLAVSQAPVVLDLFCNDYLFLLDNPVSTDITGLPMVDETCPEDPTITFSDVFSGLAECGETTITRTFTIRDGAENTVMCTQKIGIQHLKLSDVIPPPKNVFLDCGDEFLTNQNGNPDPQVSGRPKILSAFGITELNPKYCNLIATYTDQPLIPLCDGSSQFFRRWFFYDECETANTQIYDQIIRISDKTAPTVTCDAPDLDNNNEPDTLYFNTSSGSCTASIDVPLPIVTDDCSSWTVLTEILKRTPIVVIGPMGPENKIQTDVIATIPVNANNRVVTGIPVGCYAIRYTVIDDCGNKTVVECPICVIDTVQPVAVCDDNLTVSLGGGGVGSVYAVDVDEGSRDNCGIARLDVRRQLNFDPQTCEFVPTYFTDWGEYVDFYCCEAGSTMMVQFRVTDTAGNQNSCMAEIKIEDKINPSCEAPDPVTIFCNDLPDDADFNDHDMMDELFGKVELEDNCGGSSIQELTPVVDLDNCGVGTITRRFGGMDAQGNETGICQQIITVEQSLNYAIKFPKDVVSECGIPIPDTIRVFGQGCNSIAVTVDDKIFATDEKACYAIHRTYLVINACESDGVGDPIVIERNQDCIDGGGTEDVWLVMTDEGAFVDRDNDPTNTIPAAGTKSPVCDGTTNPEGYWHKVNSMGYWMYTQIIYIVDDTEPFMAVEPMSPFCVINQQSCEAPVLVEFTVDEACSADGMDIQVLFDENNDGIQDGDITNEVLTGTYPKYQINGSFPIGRHAFIVRLNDGCKNENVTKIPFDVVDCGVSAPNCLNGLLVDLDALPPGSDADGDGDVDAAAWVVDVEDMLISSNDSDCSGEVTYSIFRLDDINDGVVPDEDNKALILTCDDLGNVPVRIYSWDAADNPTALQPDGSLGGVNNSFCETFIQVQDEDLDCSTGGVAMGRISGAIMTESNDPIVGVSLRPADYMPPMMITESNGQYMLDDLEPGLDYEVRAELPDDYLNGVSTLDIIIISKHILGINLLDTPYRMIAADVNESGNISTQDIILLRRLILNVDDELPGGRSWRFIAANYDFPQPQNPWSAIIPEWIEIKDLHGHMENQNFVGIKLGDVNGSAVPKNRGSARTEKDNCYLYTEDKALNAGQWYNIDFRNTATEQIAGFQFTLEFDPTELEVSGMRHGLVREDHTGLKYLERGIIMVSWDATEADWVLPEEVASEVMFGLRVRALHGGHISELLRISSNALEAEAYASDYELMNVDLQFTGVEAEQEAYALLQNRPNPFYERTTIEFYLPQDEDAELKIFDANGRKVLERLINAQAGANQVELDKNDFPAQGIYYYRIDAGGFSATKKMILVDR